MPATPLYFCAAYNEMYQGLHPGKIGPGFSGCSIPWGGSEYTKTSYFVLLNGFPTTTADVTVGGSIPVDALVGGYDEDGATLYPCQASYGAAVVPGKTRPEFNGCNISWAGSEITVPAKVGAPYQVLVPAWKSDKNASWTFPVTTSHDPSQNLSFCHGVDNSGPGEVQKHFQYCHFAQEDHIDSNGKAQFTKKGVYPYRVLSE